MKQLVFASLIFLATDYVHADDTDEALRKATEAAIKHFKIDKMAKRLERRYIDEDVRLYGGYAFAVADVAIKKQVTFKWSF